MTITAREQEIIDEFAVLDELGDWEVKYQHIIDQGKKLPLIEPDYHTPEYKVKGCLSSVWLRAEVQDGRVHYKADSDSTLVKGLVALLLRVLNDQPPAAILAADLGFIHETGLLKEHFTQQRKNGLQAMIKQMKHYALAFQN